MKREGVLPKNIKTYIWINLDIILVSIVKTADEEAN